MSASAIATRGRLVCVGVGMTLGSHITPIAQSEIDHADVVFAGVSDAIVELWLREMHPDVRSLQPYYAAGKSRHDTYGEMVEAILVEVRAGKRVCGVFYGHPGIFALAPHQSIELARAEGYEARMEPGVSSEDCLYADLGIDPGTFGCQHFEATQFIVYKRVVDPSAWLFLWQVGLVGDLTLGKLGTGPAYRQVLVDVLMRHYPGDHEVIVYKVPTLPIERPSIRRVRLDQLVDTVVSTSETVAIPPAKALVLDPTVRERLDALRHADVA
ncbi:MULTISPECIES: SAM-dependent methyltransferase [Luteibacter]|uniref:SAM-dependent methyltransferase n=1 Tax=Luteibacter sp. dw_328 TaxID=2719796 RepID=UPI0007BEAAF9|nr:MULTISPECIES: SAM-dependent methyltransferase [Luteibacter]